MLIGVVSDTHNNLKNRRKIIEIFNNLEVSLTVHTGDITNKNSLNEFSNLNCQLVGVYGNNDRNELGLHEVATKNNFSFQEPPYILNLNKRNIAVFHEPDLVMDFLSKNKEFDLILHGHTHRFREETIGNTLIFNPGESAGLMVGKNSIGLIDLKDLSVKRIFF